MTTEAAKGAALSRGIPRMPHRVSGTRKQAQSRRTRAPRPWNVHQAFAGRCQTAELGGGSLALWPKARKRTRWKIHADRVVDDNPHVRLSVASVELPDGTRFDQYVLRMPRAAMTVVLDDAAERILLIWRHRFIIDRWVWELPGGYVDPGEDGLAAAAREVEEETGYRPRGIEHVLTFQPMAGTADAAFELYLARGADLVGAAEARTRPRRCAGFRWPRFPALIAKGDDHRRGHHHRCPARPADSRPARSLNSCTSGAAAVWREPAPQVQHVPDAAAGPQPGRDLDGPGPGRARLLDLALLRQRRAEQGEVERPAPDVRLVHLQ